MSQLRRYVAWSALVAATLATSNAAAQERRARPPQFKDSSYKDVFYSDVSKAISGTRPRIDELAGQSPAVQAVQGGGGGGGTASSNGGGKWVRLADPVNLEDEIKRLKMRYDELVTTPGRFKGGDFQKARTELALLATVFAVISEYEGEIRFKKDAAIARDLMARAVVGVSEGSGDSFDIAMQRKNDLQDLIGGSGLNRTAPAGANDWSLIATRSAMMEYLEVILDDPLQDGTVDADSVAESIDDVKRAAAMVAVIGQVLQEPGMDDADDADYNALSRQMMSAALDVRSALERNDADGARRAVGAISQACDACHSGYR